MATAIDARKAGRAWATESGQAGDDWAVDQAAHEWAAAQGDEANYVDLVMAFEHGCMDVVLGNPDLWGYVADHAWGKTLVLSDGRVFERREKPGGGVEWFRTRSDVEIEAYAAKAVGDWQADWVELQTIQEIEQLIDLSEFS